MSTYCDITDVRAVNPKRVYSSTSTPTETQVGIYITLISGEIDTILLALGLSGTITAPAEFITFLRYLNALGAAAMAEQAMFPETSETGATPHWKTLKARYESLLDKLAVGKLTPASFIAARLAGCIYSDPNTDQENYPDPSFTIDKVY